MAARNRGKKSGEVGGAEVFDTDDSDSDMELKKFLTMKNTFWDFG